MKSPRLRSLPQKYSPKSILRDITTYFEDSVFPIREINNMLQSGLQKVTYIHPHSTLRFILLSQKDKRTKRHMIVLKITMRKKKRISKVKNRKQRACFPKIVYKYLPDFLLL